MIVKIGATLIPLTQGKIAIIDTEDYEKVKGHKWYAHKLCRTYYAETNIRTPKGKKVTLPMHRLILDCKKEDITDHENNNGLDNRKSNLRKCTRKENNRNVPKRSIKMRHQYKGVHQVPSGAWSSRITFNGKTLHLGYFPTECDAAIAYDIKAKELHGEFASLNFN